MRSLWLSWLAMPFVLVLSACEAHRPRAIPLDCLGLSDPYELARCLMRTPTPNPSPSATAPTAAPTDTPSPAPRPTSSPTGEPGTPSPTSAPTTCQPPALRGINGGGACHRTKYERDGMVTCDLDFTQWFNPRGNGFSCDQRGGAPACDLDHFRDREGNEAMGPCCCWREWDEVRPINGGGFVLHVGGAEILDAGRTSHQARIRGQQGARVVVTICPPSDLQSREGIRIPVNGGHPFSAEGCGEKRWRLPISPTQRPTTEAR